MTQHHPKQGHSHSPLSWSLEGELAFLSIHSQHPSHNTLQVSLLEALESTLEEIGKHKQVKALALLSPKKDSFLSGADIQEIQNCQDLSQAQDLSLAWM